MGIVSGCFLFEGVNCPRGIKFSELVAARMVAVDVIEIKLSDGSFYQIPATKNNIAVIAGRVRIYAYLVKDNEVICEEIEESKNVVRNNLAITI